MKLNHYILAAFGLLAVMPFASCSSSGKKNAKESALAGKVYSAGFLNDKSEFYGYIISFNKDGSAQYFDSKTLEEMSFSYKEDSAKNTFQLFSADDKNNKFEGLVEGSSIKYKTSTGQEVELSSGADNFYNFIVEKYKAWNKEGEVYIAGKDDAGTKVISYIEQYDERGNNIRNLYKGTYSETTGTTEYTYDDEGRLITERTKDRTTNYSYTKRSDGTTKRSDDGGSDYEIYNKDGKVIEYEKSDGLVTEGGAFKYDDKGNVIEASEAAEGGHYINSSKTSYTYKYDSNGNVTYKKGIGRSDYDSGFDPESHGTYTNETWFEYDSNNNLIHKKSKSSSDYIYEEWYMYALYSDGKIKYKITLNNKQN
ncbi:MAG TPA: hypothetical protein DCZ76_09250 [Treponema sp.]|nr:hypothetical protein [Treponema sp.]